MTLNPCKTTGTSEAIHFFSAIIVDPVRFRPEQSPTFQVFTDPDPTLPFRFYVYIMGLLQKL
jgi:hypothetical protein